MARTIRSHGNPNGSVFGQIGDYLTTDENITYYKSSDDTLNVGWTQIYPPAPTATPIVTPTPTQTPYPTFFIGPTPSSTPTPTPTPTVSPTPVIPTPTPTVTPTAPPITPTISGSTPPQVRNFLNGTELGPITKSTGTPVTFSAWVTDSTLTLSNISIVLSGSTTVSWSFGPPFPYIYTYEVLESKIHMFNKSGSYVLLAHATNATNSHAASASIQIYISGSNITPTPTPLPAFTFTEMNVVGSTSNGDANAIIAQWVLNGSSNIEYSLSWGIPASPSNPVHIIGAYGNTLIHGETSYSVGPILYSVGSNVVGFSRPNTQNSDTVSITVTNEGTGSSGQMNYASAQGLNSILGSMVLNLVGVSGFYSYNVRNCTTNVNYNVGSAYPYLNGDLTVNTANFYNTVPPPNNISFVEVVTYNGSFSSLPLSPNSYITYPLNITTNNIGSSSLTYLDGNGNPISYSTSTAPFGNITKNSVGCGYAVSYLASGSYSFGTIHC